ncbi:MAG TPA: nucleotidyltransferase [Thermoanaerobaculia bacterium]|nr:nucleotidyltransferase [Thermoanaerobaculia bacterium]
MSTGDEYLRGLITKYAAPTGPNAPVLQQLTPVYATIRSWAGSHLLNLSLSGSYAKGTAVHGDADADLFISLASTATQTLREIFESLRDTFSQKGYAVREQNVSIRLSIGKFSVDLVPAKKQAGNTTDHSLYVRKHRSWQQTNIQTHIALITSSGRREEILLLKIWRAEQQLDFPSIYLELCTLRALSGKPRGDVANNVWAVLHFLRDDLATARIVDPANTNNIISDDMTAREKAFIAAAASRSLTKKYWSEVIW